MDNGTIISLIVLSYKAPQSNKRHPKSLFMDQEKLYKTIGKIAEEKHESIRSKLSDNTATEQDRRNGELLSEIIAMAKNRLTVAENEKIAEKGGDVWVERTSKSHFPHIRLHGGALEDDPPHHSFDK